MRIEALGCARGWLSAPLLNRGTKCVIFPFPELNLAPYDVAQAGPLFNMEESSGLYIDMAQYVGVPHFEWPSQHSKSKIVIY